MTSIYQAHLSRRRLDLVPSMCADGVVTFRFGRTTFGWDGHDFEPGEVYSLHAHRPDVFDNLRAFLLTYWPVERVETVAGRRTGITFGG
ncbi:MAG: hypothetical protein AAF822_03375 [Pseudomonadota bacterium]